MIDFGTPVEIFGLQIRTGDLLFGDCHGVISIPHEIASQLPAVSARQVEQERRVMKLCESPESSVAGLRSELDSSNLH